MSEPCTLTPEEQVVSRTVIMKPGLSGDDWYLPELAALRARLRQHYSVQQFATCCYCKQGFMSTSGLVWDVEHVAPKSLYPKFMFEPLNLAVACKECNSAKRAFEVLVRPKPKRYPKRSQAFLIVHPHFDKYDDNILRSKHLYAPISAKGVETIRACNLVRIAQAAAKMPDGVLDTRFESAVNEAFQARADQRSVRVTVNVVVPAAGSANGTPSVAGTLDNFVPISIEVSATSTQ
jgi:hypothetical protein